MSRYKITFKVNGKGYSIILPPKTGINDIVKGFWVGENYEWPGVLDGRYYIMPHQITCVEKIKPGSNQIEFMCSICKGTGVDPIQCGGVPVACTNCNGTGRR